MNCFTRKSFWDFLRSFIWWKSQEIGFLSNEKKSPINECTRLLNTRWLNENQKIYIQITNMHHVVFIYIHVVEFSRLLDLVSFFWWDNNPISCSINSLVCVINLKSWIITKNNNNNEWNFQNEISKKISRNSTSFWLIYLI